MDPDLHRWTFSLGDDFAVVLRLRVRPRALLP
jgi:hypothetical protein